MFANKLTYEIMILIFYQQYLILLLYNGTKVINSFIV